MLGVSDAARVGSVLQYSGLNKWTDVFMTTARQGQGSVYNPRKSEKVAALGSVGEKPLGLGIREGSSQQGDCVSLY